MVRLSLLSICTAAILSSTFAREASPPVQVEVQAPWTAPNLGLEILEHVSAENSSAYFPFLSDLVELVPNVTSTQYMYTELLSIIQQKHYIQPDLIDITKLALAMRSTAPKVEAYHHYYSNVVVPRMNTTTKMPFDENCDSWVEFDGQQFCSPDKLQKAITASRHIDSQDIQVLPFDHILTSASEEAGTAVLYGDVMSTTFSDLHNILYKAAQDDKVTYIIRYKPGSHVDDKVILSGYGIELALKNTDYLVIDDRDVSAKEEKSSFKQKLVNFGKQVEENLFGVEKITMEPLTAGQINDLGVKAAEFILDSKDALSTLKLLSQDFPKYANSLTDIEVKQSLIDEIASNQAFGVQPGMNAMWLNGISLDADHIDPFSLLNSLKKERVLIQALINIGITPADAINLLTHSAFSTPKHGNDQADDIFDVRDDSVNENLVIWWNDIENDEMYSDWPDDIFDLLKPTYPGQLRTIRKNIFNVLFTVDLSQPKWAATISGSVQDMVKKGYPIRFGVVPKLGSNRESPETLMAICMHNFVEAHGAPFALQFLNEALQISHSTEEKQLSYNNIKAAFDATSDSLGRDESEKTFDQVIHGYDDYIKDMTQYQKRLGIFDNSDQAVFINGKLFLITEDQPWVQILNMGVGQQMQEVARKIYFGEIHQNTNIYEHLLSQPHVQKRRSNFIIESELNPLSILALEKIDYPLHTLHYLHRDQTPQIASTSIWTVANLDSAEGITLVQSALEAASADPMVRVTIIHNPFLSASDSAKLTDPDTGMKLSNVIYQALYDSDITVNDTKSMFEAALQSESHVRLVDQIKAFSAGSPIVEMITGGHTKDWSNLFSKLKNAGLQEDFQGVIINGRIVGPGINFTTDDFELLIEHETKKRIGPVTRAYEEIQIDATVESGEEYNDQQTLDPDMVMLLTSLISRASQVGDFTIFVQNQGESRNRIYHKLNGEHCKIVSGDISKAKYQFGVILDPASESAQKWSAILGVLAHVEDVYMEIYLNPNMNLEQLPLKRFYRYVLDNELHFDENGELEHPTAYFGNLPEDPLYTLGTEEIKSWHITPKVANYDLDNILLKAIESSHRENGVIAVFELEYILVDGHCRDMSSQGPPRGLQFVLGSATSANITDTIVMANLGYFQLKANPGVWLLSLREGRSKEIYELESVGNEGWISPTIEESGNSIDLLTFQGATIYPRVRKYKGKEREDVLETSNEGKDTTGKNDGTWASLKSKIFKSKPSENHSVSDTVHAEINIFSVASGHLYERFLSIMILSVLEHTDSTVKFWFIENFLSPKFKDLIPEMAQEFGFRYEFVTYKWPSWLRAQTERQRTIWGYKILFLDVLFPLNLDKVIFVDADQIVRTNLKELVDMDLKGAPYGYTPFCDDRREMDGFRFWKQGYWKEFLRDKPYHISALYVVDLVRFRQLAAGDRLRAQYQQLSADPHSLANLDQDLPNNMQHDVPIFSLPQEWLWCETWCSDESLKTAKTIDLCNNPLTKEPKLDRARRQVPEWEKYDNEVADFQKRLKKRKTTATESNASESTDKSNLIQDQKIEYTVEQEDIIDVLDDMGQQLPGSQQEAAVRDEL
ncbi:UDP-glucose:glycoprotein glucosyltransferase-domain-containing protein [Umbelopsis sp. PMI_123]|nr:UDP-glucose:glycoprotein glucosyltransferase-domain-containing protein [Umbelopsis sp. PMI_123]